LALSGLIHLISFIQNDCVNQVCVKRLEQKMKIKAVIIKYIQLVNSKSQVTIIIYSLIIICLGWLRIMI